MSPARRRATRVTLIHRSGEVASEPIELRILAREAGVQPGAVSRFVALGLIEPIGGSAGHPLFARDAAALLASAMRLQRDLGLNYAGAALACELLVRIERLEAGRPDRAAADPDAGDSSEPPRSSRR